MIRPFYEKQVRQSIILASGCTIFGFALSLILKDAEIFPRFGALVACIGIYFVAFRIGPILNLAIKNSEELGKTLESLLRAGIKPDEDYLVSTVKSESNDLKKESSEGLIKLESKIVMAGTIIWAFGDLIVKCLL